MDTQFQTRVADYLSRQLDLPGLQVGSARALMGGISRTTVRVDARLPDGSARAFILRLDPASSLLASGRLTECTFMRALADQPGLIVPPVLCNEDDPSHLGTSFMVTGLLPGTADGRMFFAPDHAAAAPRIAREGFTVLGRLAALDPAPLVLGPAVAEVAPQDVWKTELARWERKLAQHPGGALPVVAAALRWLHRSAPPPPARVAVVHGDYRLGNYLFDTSGVTGILDWEMGHLGDPLEDLAWAMLPNWAFRAHPDKVAGFLTREEAVAAWEAASGLRADPAALRWWLMLCHVKAAALWAAARHAYLTEALPAIEMAPVALIGLGQQELMIIEEMERAR